MVDELIVECINSSAGCKHTCQRQLLSSHLRDTCEYVQVHCSEEGCDKLVYRKNLGKHTHDCIHKILNCDACGASVEAANLQVCGVSMLPIPCFLIIAILIQAHYAECAEQEIACADCLFILRRAELAEHRLLCPETRTTCIHYDNGCPWVGKRASLTAHLSSCSYEAIKGFFVINNERMSTLYQENAILRQKLEQAEATTCGLTRELSTIRNVLGPWWSSKNIRSTSGGNGASQPESEATRSQEQSRWQTSTDTNSESLSDISGSLNSLSIGENRPDSYSDLLASHFPRDIGSSSNTSPVQPDPPSWYSGPPSQHPHSRGNFPFSHSRIPDFQTPMPSSGLYFSPNGPSFTIPRITPLDFDAPLSRTIQTLHEDLLALLSSLDSLARLTDISLTTENLRMNEEVGALRAVIHGLRMQVHALITERNSSVWNTGGPSSSAGASSTGISQLFPPPHRSSGISSLSNLHPPLLFGQTAQTTKL